MAPRNTTANTATEAPEPVENTAGSGTSNVALSTEATRVGDPQALKVAGQDFKRDASVNVPDVQIDTTPPPPTLDQKTLEKIAQELHDAVKQTSWLGLANDPDKSKAFRLLEPLSKEDRKALEQIYHDKFDKNGAPDSLRRDIKDRFGELDYRRAEAVLNRTDGRTNDAGNLMVALTQLKDDKGKGSAEVVAVLKGLNSAQLKQLDADFNQQYGKSYLDVLKSTDGLSKAVKDGLPELTKGSDKRTAQDVVKLVNLAVDNRDSRLYGAFIAGDSPAAVEARKQLNNDSFKEKLANTFTSDAATKLQGYGVDISKLPVEQRVDQRALDYLKEGHISLATIASENTGKWIFNNKENIELAARNATVKERDQFKTGMSITQAGRQPANDAEKEALAYFNKIHKAFKGGGNDRETAIWEDHLANGKPTIISEMARTHSDGWGPFSWGSGHSKQDLISKAENLSKEDWERLRSPDGPRFRKEIEQSLSTFADAGERQRIMQLIDQKAQKTEYVQADGVRRSTQETIRDNTDNGWFSTSYNKKNIIESLSHAGADEATKIKTDANYRNQLKKFVNDNLNDAEKLYANRLIDRMERTGAPIQLDATDKVLNNRINGAKAPETIKDIEAMLSDKATRDRLSQPADKLSPEDKKLKQIIDDSVSGAIATKFGYPPHYQMQASRIFKEEFENLYSQGKLSPELKLRLGVPKQDLYADIASAPQAQRDAAMKRLSSDEQSIVRNVVNQGGKLDLTDRIRAFIISDSKDYQQFENDLKNLTPAQKQQLKDDYQKKYNGAINDDFLKKIDENVGDRNNYKQYLTPSASDGRQAGFDNYRQFLESNSGFSADGSRLTLERSTELQQSTQEEYQRQFQKLTPEQQAAMNQYFGDALKQFKDSKEKLAEIMVDATITAAALAAAPFTAGMSTAALLTFIGTSAAAGAAFRVAAMKTIQGNDFDGSVKNVLKQAITGGVSTALAFVGTELVFGAGKLATTVGTTVAKDLFAVAGKNVLKEGAERILTQELTSIAANRGMAGLGEKELASLVGKVASPTATAAERQALKEAIQVSYGKTYQQCQAKIAAELAEQGIMRRAANYSEHVWKNSLIGGGSNVAAEIAVAPFHGIEWDKLQTGALVGLAVGAVIPIGFKVVGSAFGAGKTFVSNITKEADGFRVDPKNITEPVSYRNRTTGEVRTFEPNQGQSMKLTNDWEYHSGGKEAPQNPQPHAPRQENVPPRQENVPPRDENVPPRDETTPREERKPPREGEGDNQGDRTRPVTDAPVPAKNLPVDQARIQQIQKELAEIQNKPPIGRDQFKELIEKIPAGDRGIALELLEQSLPNLHRRALDAQLESLQKQIKDLQAQGVRKITVVASADDSSGKALAYLLKTNTNMEVEIKVLNAQTIKDGISPSNPVLMLDDVSKLSGAQADFLRKLPKVYASDLNGFNTGINVWDLAVAKLTGNTETMQTRIAEMVEQAKQLKAANPGMSNEQAIQQVLRGPLDRAKAEFPNMEIIRPELPERTKRTRGRSIDDIYDQAIRRPIYDPRKNNFSDVTDNDIKNFLDNYRKPPEPGKTTGDRLTDNEKLAAAIILRDTMKVNSYESMLNEMQELQKKLVGSLPPGKTMDDVVILTGLEENGSNNLIHHLYSQTAGLKPQNFVSAAEFQANPGKFKDKVLVYLDDYSFTGRQPEKLLTKPLSESTGATARPLSEAIKESGAPVIIAHLGGYLPEQKLQGVFDFNPKIIYSHEGVLPQIFDSPELAKLGFTREELQALVGNPGYVTKDPERNVDIALLNPYKSHPTNNRALISDYINRVLKEQGAKTPRVPGRQPKAITQIGENLYRGGATKSPEEFAQMVEQTKADVVIDLRGGPGGRPELQNVADEAAWASQIAGRQVDVHNIGIPTEWPMRGSPSYNKLLDDLHEFERIVQQAKNDGKNVVFHCYHGEDRTGLVNAVHDVIAGGKTVDEALAQWQALGSPNHPGFHALFNRQQFEQLIADYRARLAAGG